MFIRGHIPGRKHIPISADEYLFAFVAISASAFEVMDIARIDVTKAVFHRDHARLGQRFWWRAWLVHHFIVWMKRREVQWYVGP